MSSNPTVHRNELPADLDDPVARALLSSRIPARLAYCWRDGTPRVVPIWFHWDGTQIVMATPPGAPKLKALHDDVPVAVTIDSQEWPYKVLSIRGRARVSKVTGVCAEYAEAAERYFGPEQGSAWLSRFPPEVEMWRIAIVPEQVRILDFETRFPSGLTS
ncbi:pyridoxamine 5'-phosphate oxidase family protein [Pseudonocardia kujensis]|uniref:pyridoxamine 5'-phosphate oxidase family protein n=1 Tax=Pseudonocardia kujensis TaxID=1128675 RepID=UPI001E42E1CB|nr:pyridoxamine 5'-phosphate oxidase family protein [Pseudonocardia kujensis]MCE0762165.1 pyridoxamine 5'-phosphate oxidase family protein [Pseudonocardia kujensis]